MLLNLSKKKAIFGRFQIFKAGPLEVVLVIFGRSFLNFFYLKGLENMKNDTTFVRMRSSDHVGDAKMSKKTPCFVEFNFFTNRNGQKRFSQNERRRADLQNIASIFLIFAWGLMHLSIASPGVLPPPPPRPGEHGGFDRFALPGGGEFDHEVGYGGGAH